jgi:5-methylcytosine-specific restriction enzyme subunit McrC
MNKVFEDIVGLGLRNALSDYGLRVVLQHSDHLDQHRQVAIRPDIVVRDASGSVAAVADVKYKRPSTDGISPEDVYQAVAYATRYGLDSAALIFAEPPRVTELHVGDITIRLLSVDLSTTALERERATAAIAHTWLEVGRAGLEPATNGLAILGSRQSLLLPVSLCATTGFAISNLR